LFTVVYCCLLLFTVVYCCLLLFTVVYCCLLLFTVVYCCLLLLMFVGRLLWHHGACHQKYWRYRAGYFGSSCFEAFEIVQIYEVRSINLICLRKASYMIFHLNIFHKNIILEIREVYHWWDASQTVLKTVLSLSSIKHILWSIGLSSLIYVFNK
jgi:hypothetical protein